MDGNIHVYEQRSSFRAIKGKSPGKQIFPCRGCMAPPMWSQCCHFLLATCPQQHICFCFSFYLPVLTMCQRGEICSGLFRKLCCPQLKRNVSSALSSDHRNGCLHVCRHCGVTELPWATYQETEILHFADISNMVTFNNIASFHSLFKALYPSLGRKTCS